MSWEKSLLRRVAEVEELSIVLRAKAALDAFLIMTELRSDLSFDRHMPEGLSLDDNVRPASQGVIEDRAAGFLKVDLEPIG